VGGEAGPARWAGVVVTIGLALVAVATAQVISSVIEGLTMNPGQPNNIPNSWYHRFGFPFGGLGSGAVLFLVLGVAFTAVPWLLGDGPSETQDLLVGVALPVVVGSAFVIAVGSVLAVVNSLHEYAAQSGGAPGYVRIQLATFLLGALGTAATAIGGALATMTLRRRWRQRHPG
jgi:hypothetical protein